MKKRVLLGMSGGVDSSTSAFLLQEQGYEVVGCTLILWEGAESSSKRIVEDAKDVCDTLGIEHHVFDFKEQFQRDVIDDFVSEYENARTPNPCVVCNRKVKFGLLIEKADELNCEYIATGHYATTKYSEQYGQYVLQKGTEERKDQSYFLYDIKPEHIQRIIFPLQNYVSKDEVRAIARKAGLEVASKKESQEICFITDKHYQTFLYKYMQKEARPGNIKLSSTGEIVGKHKGLINHTIGQRKGLGIAYKEPLYVIRLDKEKNEVIVGNEKELYTTTLYASEVNWQVPEEKIQEVTCFAKIRYRSKECEVSISKVEEDKIKVDFKEPQRAVTPGQSVVFYDKDGIVLGGAKIDMKF